MAADETDIEVEVAYATPEVQRVLGLRLPAGTTAGEALSASSLLDEFPEIDAHRAPLGIYGEVCGRDRVLRSGDRVEVYRPLQVDPKAARRRRAQN